MQAVEALLRHGTFDSVRQFQRYSVVVPLTPLLIRGLRKRLMKSAEAATAPSASTSTSSQASTAEKVLLDQVIDAAKDFEAEFELGWKLRAASELAVDQAFQSLGMEARDSVTEIKTATVRAPASSEKPCHFKNVVELCSAMASRVQALMAPSRPSQLVTLVLSGVLLRTNTLSAASLLKLTAARSLLLLSNPFLAMA